MKFNENKIRHLEMIQAIITRMSTNSFVLKGWLVSILSGISVVGLTTKNVCLLLIVLPTIIIFWMLDAYYLQLERKYRILYSNVVSLKIGDVDFNLQPPKSSCEGKTTYFQSMFSITEAGFYLPSLIITIIINYIIFS